MPHANVSSPRERLLSAADELFYERGIHAVGVDAVVERSRTARASLYSHFGSKEDLVAAYLEQRSDQARERISRALTESAGRDPQERLLVPYEVLAATIASPRFRGCPFINALSEFPEAGHPVRRVVEAHRGFMLDVFTALCDEAGVASLPDTAAQMLMLYDAALQAAYTDPTLPAAELARGAAVALTTRGPGRPEA